MVVADAVPVDVAATLGVSLDAGGYDWVRRRITGVCASYWKMDSTSGSKGWEDEISEKHNSGSSAETRKSGADTGPSELTYFQEPLNKAAVPPSRRVPRADRRNLVHMRPMMTLRRRATSSNPLLIQDTWALRQPSSLEWQPGVYHTEKISVGKSTNHKKTRLYLNQVAYSSGSCINFVLILEDKHQNKTNLIHSLVIQNPIV